MQSHKPISILIYLENKKDILNDKIDKKKCQNMIKILTMNCSVRIPVKNYGYG